MNRRNLTISLLVAFFLFISSCKAEHGAYNIILPPAKPTPIDETTNKTFSLLKGYVLLNSVLKYRLFEIGTPFDIGYAVDDSILNGEVSLLSLLGAYLSFDGKNTFINGATNPMNMLLANIIFTKISEDIALKCPGQPSLLGAPYPLYNESSLPQFNSNYQNALNEICSWPLEASNANQKLTNYWLTVMNYDAPQSELDAWLEFANSQEMRSKPTKDAIWSLNMTLFLSPHFLLNVE